MQVFRYRFENDCCTYFGALGYRTVSFLGQSAIGGAGRRVGGRGCVA